MNIYIAGRYEARTRLIEWRGRVIEKGHTVTSTWLDEVPTREEVDDNYILQAAERDIEELCASDLLILDTLDNNATGGREVEYGIAYLRGLDLWIVGPRVNIFHQLADKRFTNWVDATNELPRVGV